MERHCGFHVEWYRSPTTIGMKVQELLIASESLGMISKIRLGNHAPGRPTERIEWEY
jgi:hypothetical protein